MNLLAEMDGSMICEQVIRSITEMGFTKLTPIQENAIPVLLEGFDVIGQAQTGTGKTAAFGIPLIQKIDVSEESVQGLVLCSTRELAIQVSDELRKFAKYMHGVKVLPIYGGADMGRQIKLLKSNVSIVVGTPGRVMDHMRRGTLKLENIKMLILDEADEMLNMGFREDIETILKDIPKDHQTALFSATMPKPILEITRKYLKEDSKHIKIAAKELTMTTIKQYYYEVNSHNKDDVAIRLLEYYNPKRSLIFCNTKSMVDRLGEVLKNKGFQAEGLHGDLSQFQRDRVMNGFRSGRTKILIATDVAARGIDVDDVEAVINYDIPQDIEFYVHRIGRTGRAGKEGRAFTLVVGKERYRIRDIEHVCKNTMKRREVPKAKDVMRKKYESLFDELLVSINEHDLSKQAVVISEKLEENSFELMDVAVALMKMVIGEEPKEIVIERYVPKSNYPVSDYGRRRSQGSQSGRGHDRNGRRIDDRGNRGNDKNRRWDENRKRDKGMDMRRERNMDRNVGSRYLEKNKNDYRTRGKKQERKGN